MDLRRMGGPERPGLERGRERPAPHPRAVESADPGLRPGQGNRLMKFFFPDAQDLVDPSFDFEAETRSEERVRQRDDLYAHEIFPEPPYDGLLVSKAIVEGQGGDGSRY